MLPLDDPLWQSLEGGYHDVYDASPALRRLLEAATAQGDDRTVITVPHALVPEIRRLIASHKTA